MEWFDKGDLQFSCPRCNGKMISYECENNVVWYQCDDCDLRIALEGDILDDYSE